MSNRLYRLLFGALLLLALYFDIHPLQYGLVGMAMLEGVSNLRLPTLVSRLFHLPLPDAAEGSLGIDFRPRTGFAAERGWRLMVALLLAISLFVFPDALWFFPWFMGFAILGAGISGVCPMFLLLKWAGLR